MIAALLGITPVEIEDSDEGAAFIRSLGRNNIGQTKVDGSYTGSKRTVVAGQSLMTTAQVIPDDCPQLMAWIDAMNDTDQLTDDCPMAVAAALEIEERAHQAFVEFIQASAARKHQAAILFFSNSVEVK